MILIISCLKSNIKSNLKQYCVIQSKNTYSLDYKIFIIKFTGIQKMKISQDIKVAVDAVLFG